MSKGLEALKETKEIVYLRISDGTRESKLQPRFEIIEKELEALEIIIAKNVNIKLVKMCSYVVDYNDMEDEELTYNEFMAVKEVLL